uniref:Uncharacterized protein n=1 Tax=Physcomitrium patens TaxID=3218 RepID=A0A2K1IUH9_PHYPA|nr:hypothetical protein PHYPA_024877 [Physcomitrium patens]
MNDVVSLGKCPLHSSTSLLCSLYWPVPLMKRFTLALDFSDLFSAANYKMVFFGSYFN